MNITRAAPPALSFALSIAFLLLGGCANGQQQVAGRNYNVPAANLVQKSAYPFFVSQTEGNAFSFTLNPQSELHEQTVVVVEAREDVCARANGRGYVARTICGHRDVEWQGYNWLRKGDDIVWTYSPDNPDWRDAPVVSCYGMENEGHSGLCSAALALGDLVLTFGVRDDDVPTLEAIYQRAASMLRSWQS